MKGIICGIKRMEVHDGDGLRTTVFFKGCPLRCVWCHNPESLSAIKQVAYFREKCINCGICKGERTEKTVFSCPTDALVLYGAEYEAEALVEEVAKDAIFFQNSGGGVTLSGGECLMQADFVFEVAEKLKQGGISVYVDTCGYVPRKALEKMIPVTDKFLYDIKAIDEAVHRRCTGRDNKQILDNLSFLSEQGCRVEIRYPLVMGYNDKECEKIGRFLSSQKRIDSVRVLQYHAFAKSRYEALSMEQTMPETKTFPQDVERAVEILKSYGLHAINGITSN